jgi:hypothetical protein
MIPVPYLPEGRGFRAGSRDGVSAGSENTPIHRDRGLDRAAVRRENHSGRRGEGFPPPLHPSADAAPFVRALGSYQEPGGDRKRGSLARVGRAASGWVWCEARVIAVVGVEKYRQASARTLAGSEQADLRVTTTRQYPSKEGSRVTKRTEDTIVTTNGAVTGTAAQLPHPETLR